jgi:hypothetical protein
LLCCCCCVCVGGCTGDGDEDVDFLLLENVVVCDNTGERGTVDCAELSVVVIRISLSYLDVTKKKIKKINFTIKSFYVGIHFINSFSKNGRIKRDSIQHLK